MNASSALTVTTAPLHVREARPEEYAEVGALSVLGFAGPPGPGHRPQTPEREALLRDAASRAEQGDLLIAVRQDTGRIIGTASLLRPGGSLCRQSRGPDEAELRLLAVAPDARREGAARALMGEAIVRARAWGVPALVLDTGQKNEAAQRLYRGLGFVRVPERETLRASRGGFLSVFRYELT